MSDPAMADNARQSMDVDIVCVGFGPAMGGFLTTLSRALAAPENQGNIESAAMPGMPPQVICYERADDIGFGVSGVVTRARGIRASFPDLDPSQIPLATEVKHERLLYLLDPVGASQRSFTLKLADWGIKALRFALPYENFAFRMPYIPPFLRKEPGLLLSIGQFNQWVGSQLMGEGMVQIWPGTPVDSPLIENDRVAGVRLVDQGVDKQGNPDAGFMPGMDIRAALTVLGDGPVGPVSRKIDEHFGMPDGHHRHEWAVGMKVVADLRPDAGLEPGTVFHTFGYPEPGIFGFLYVYPGNVVSAGIFVPSWFDNPARTSYRYLQHWMMHPYLWRYLEGGTMRSFGAKSLLESGQRGEPYLAGEGYARIGEGSGSTNVLTGSGVDEAWTTGVQLGEGVVELLKEKQPFTRENLARAYVARRRDSWVEQEARVAKKSRDGFSTGVVAGIIGMGLAGMTKGMLHVPGKQVAPHKKLKPLHEYYKDRIAPKELAQIQSKCEEQRQPLHDALMDKMGWPAIPLDGKLLVSHQDALLLGGKVQAAGGYRDHVQFLKKQLCEGCRTKVCVEMCSGQAITIGDDGGMPAFDREKCLHCGACAWNCTKAREDDPERPNIEFIAGSGGLHSAEN